MRRSDFVFVPFVMDLTVAMSQLMVNFRALDLGASPVMVGVLLGVCWCLPYMLVALATGRIVARFGARRPMLVGAAVFGAGAALYGAAHAPWVLLAAAPLGGGGSALFWPSLQTYLHVADPDETRRRTGTFNVSWTLGILAGTGLAGHAYDWLGPHVSFVALGGVVGAMVAVMALRVGAPVPLTASDIDSLRDGLPAAPHVLKRHLHLAWVANFAAWFAGSLAVTVFPRLARSVGMPDGSIGEAAAFAWVGQACVFALMTAVRGWHYRAWPIAVALCGSAAAVTLMGRGAGSLPFFAAFLLLGSSRAPAHLASITYGLDDTHSREANMGYHEGILGAGSVLGPLLAGFVADRWGLRAPYEIAAAAALLAAAAVCFGARSYAVVRAPVRPL